MADLDPYILFQGAGGVNPTQNAATQVSLSRLAMDQKTRAIQDAQQQIALQQAQRQNQYEQNLADVLGKVSRGELGANPPLSPGEVAAAGGSPATPTGTSPTGAPTLLTPPSQSDTPVAASDGTTTTAPTSSVPGAPPPQQQTTTVWPQQVQPGVGALPGPGGIDASGAPITQISANVQPQDRPSIGEMMGPVGDESVSAASPQPVIAPKSPTPAPPAIPAPVSPQQTPAPPARPPSLASSTINWVGPVRDEMIKRGFADKILPWEQAITKHINDQRIQNANVTEGEMKATIARHKQADEELTAFIKGTPQAMQEQQWPAFINDQVRKNNLTPQEAAQYRQFPGAAQLPVLHTYLRGQTQINEDVLKQNQAREADIRARAEESRLKGEDLKNFQNEREDVASALSEAKTKDDYARVYSQISNPKVRATFPPPEAFDPVTTPDRVLRSGMTMEQKLKLQEAQKNPTEWSLYLKAANGDPKKALADWQADKIKIAKASKTDVNVSVPLGGGNKDALTGEAFLRTLSTPDAARVKAIAEGRENPITGIGASRGPGAAIMAAVEQYDPTWSAQRAQVRKAFTSGPDGRNIGNLNTAPVHLAALADAGTAMANNTFVPGNQVYNYVSSMFGGTPPGNFDAMKTVVAGEMASAMKGNATDPEIASFNKSVARASSPAQLSGVIKDIFIPAIRAKLNTFDERYHALMPDDPWSPVLPSAKQVFAKYSTADPRSQYIAGHVYGGLTYLGGDPQNSASWKK